MLIATDTYPVSRAPLKNHGKKCNADTLCPVCIYRQDTMRGTAVPNAKDVIYLAGEELRHSPIG